MDWASAFQGLNALAVIVPVVITGWYAGSTVRMFRAMNRQARIMALTAPVSANAALVESTYDETNAKAALKRLLRELEMLAGES